MVKTTPYSQICNILIFIPFALLTTSFITLLFQAIFIFLSIMLFKIRYRDLRYHHLLSLLPIVLFIFILNSFRGGGEIIFRAGPVIIVKQGILRGLYFSLFIIELYFMSRALACAFPREQFVSVLFTVDHVLLSKIRKKGSASHPTEGFVVILYYIMRIFFNTYSELKIFFKSSVWSLKERVIVFIRNVFVKSVHDYESSSITDVHIIHPRITDYLSISLEFIILISAYLTERIFGLTLSY